MLIAFVPVLHKGYVELFKKYPGQLGLLGADVIADFTSLTRDLRVIDPAEMRKAVFSLELFDEVFVMSKLGLEALDGQSIIMPEDDISHAVHAQYFPNSEVIFEPIFLRWDRQISTAEHIVDPNRTITHDELHTHLISLAALESTKSADWWRQIGALIVKDGIIVAQAHNHHLPTDFHLSAHGDPRSNFDAGTNLDIYTSIHGEASAIAQAARDGISLKGSAMYSTVFPCPNCARIICEAGISRVYYEKGYSRVDAEQIFKAFNVEIILVQ